MKKSDALAILGLSGEVTQADIMAAYKSLIRKFHPDVNPAGEQMTKMLNAARDALKDWEGNAEEQGESQADYGDALNAAINAIIDLDGLAIEICGAWVWVSGNTRTHKDALKTAGYRYASKKKMWNFRPNNWRSASRGSVPMADIRARYGSRRPARQYRTERDQISA